MMICPECKSYVSEDAIICDKCGFDLALYRQVYDEIYDEKIKKLNEEENFIDQSPKMHKTTVYNESVHKPRCPYCNSENLTKITSLDRAVNIAVFGILGNKRKYQWHCNNCRSYW